ncbi:hypothetical protein BD769DRAFT_1675003 [Suillus cothurnatus]|nr:hypothetical protein BD769DRAFT_1675003 [Suillus cothurnatus]
MDRHPRSHPSSIDFVPVSSDHQHHDNANDGVNSDAPPAPQLDDIKIEYHPHSKIPSTVHPFSDFSHHCPTEDTIPRHASPWEPFRTRLDFEAFELMRRAASAKEDFTLQSHDEVRTLWKMASERFTPFETSTISVPHHGEAREYTMYSRCLWNWALDLMRDIRFAPHFVFDAQRLYKFNGAWFVRFIDEPWTANAFWDAQSRLPPDAKPLVFILYANKAKLSSFGTEKGYPIVVRIANLPVEIRNGTGVGGGRVVGWLPIHNITIMYPGHFPAFARCIPTLVLSSHSCTSSRSTAHLRVPPRIFAFSRIFAFHRASSHFTAI